jgi:2-oxoacid:acceptor oxidoreductase gamma subunit (pyruvate/2-ketoisovalerate family)
MTIHRVRLHGRGGQGAVTAAKNLAPALHREDRNVQAIPSFGVERRGAPVEAYLKFTDEPDEWIPTRTYVHEPDILVVMDDTLFESTEAEDITRGLATDGTVIVNTRSDPGDLDVDASRVATVNGGEVAAELIGRSHIVNTVLLGSFAAATDVVSIENVQAAIRERFPENRRETNVEAARRGYEETAVPAAP